MAFEDEPVIDILRSLRPITPDRRREARVQARCRSAIRERCTRRKQSTGYQAGLGFICATAVLCAYLAALFAQALRFAAHY